MNNHVILRKNIQLIITQKGKNFKNNSQCVQIHKDTEIHTRTHSPALTAFKGYAFLGCTLHVLAVVWWVSKS